MTVTTPPPDFQVTSIPVVNDGATVRFAWNSQADATYRIARE